MSRSKAQFDSRQLIAAELRVVVNEAGHLESQDNWTRDAEPPDILALKSGEY
jgi:hypothetical protein